MNEPNTQSVIHWIQKYTMPNCERCVRNGTEDCDKGYCACEAKAMEAALLALEKQIPKKPVVKPDKYSDVIQRYYCPNCGRYFGQAGIHNVIMFNKEKFCQGEGCGQAINWVD